MIKSIGHKVYNDDELVEILLGKDSDVRAIWLNNYAQSKGFESYAEYKESVAREHGFRDWEAYGRFLGRKKGKSSVTRGLMPKDEAIAVLKNKERVLAEYTE